MNKIPDMRRNAKEVVSLLKAISHESRLLILCLLTQKEMSAGELASHSDLSQSAFSQYLSVLRRESLVTTRKVAQTVFYTIKA